MDRWNIVTILNYLNNNEEEQIILSKMKKLNNKNGKDIIKSMVATADLSRSGFMNGDISTVMSPRTVLTWAENYLIFDDIEYAFKLSFLNRCDELERPIIEEYFQRSFGIDISDAKDTGLPVKRQKADDEVGQLNLIDKQKRLHEETTYRK